MTNAFRETRDVPAKTPLAEGLSKELRKRGFRFVGPTIVYAYLQAVGVVNDHLVGCPRHRAVSLTGSSLPGSSLPGGGGGGGVCCGWGGGK